MQKIFFQKGFALTILVLFIGLSVIPSAGTVIKKSSILYFNGNTLYVGGDEPGNYTTIQDAIDNATDGDTVYVFDNSSPYYENIVVDKSINIIGEDRDTTVIDGSEEGVVVHISADLVNISGFTMQRTKWYSAAIYIGSNFSNIYDNNITGNVAPGIRLDGANNTITGNIFWDNFHVAIRLNHSSNNTITGNTISNNEDGIELQHSSNNTISGNTISNNWQVGIKLNDCSNNIIMGNIISFNNGDGIYLEGGSNSNNIITDNNISNNWDEGIELNSSSSNTIYHNNFIDNYQNAYDEDNNSWDNSYPSGGNYWVDYNGTDNDSDGIGDDPYPIPGGSNQDRYPLYYPIGENRPIVNFTYEADGLWVTFDASSSFDRDGTIESYYWDFGDGGSGGSGMIVYYHYSSSGVYNVTLWVTDNDGYEDNITKIIVVEEINYPPEPPLISGPYRGKPGKTYFYNFSVNDPNDDNVSYLVDWGDNTSSGWTDFVSPGINVTLNHTWNEKGVYIIKAKAKDWYDAESLWSYYGITIPRYKMGNNLLFQRLIEKFLNAFPVLRQLLGI